MQQAVEHDEDVAVVAAGDEPVRGVPSDRLSGVLDPGDFTVGNPLPE
ncbi:MAG TPA: hypothetical protein VN520_02675 [Streptomyces sp.]|nr:hypothetical protein [Streptomyces sp.]